MKTNNIKFLSIAIAMIITMGSCSDEFLQIDPKGTNLEANYYTNQTEAFAGLTSVYDLMRKNSGGFENMITLTNAASDDFFAGGGGGTDGLQFLVMTDFTVDSKTVAGSFWGDHYQGVSRANYLLTKLPDVPMDDALKTRYTAETKALRANYYFNLVRMFKNIPLILVPLAPSEYYGVTQASPADVYAQIEKDLTEAITVLPATIPDTEKGRFTKGSAQALLGKVYLYEGKKAEAATVLAAVNGTPGGTSQYGYKLLSSYDDLWVTTNKFNTESIIEVSHTNAGSSWGNEYNGEDESSVLNVMCGPRNYARKDNSAPDLPSGWSFNMITPDFYNFIKADPRFGATVLDMKALEAAGKASYSPGGQDTGYFLNKFVPRRSDVHTGPGEPVLNYKQNTYVIRLADTYLMEAEALGATGARAQALLDAVRERAGLSPVPVSLAAIKAERRLELGGEGHRFFDLVRWGDAATVLASRGFVAGKNEILPIPYKELLNTKIVQNPQYN
jgi:hypothetical protein